MTRQDYQRGREAIGYLAGKRLTLRSVPAKRGQPRALFGLAFVAILVGAAGVLTLPRLIPSLGGSPGTAVDRPLATPNIAVGPAMVGGQPTIMPAREIRFATWDEAKARASFSLRTPGWTPPGFWLSALQSFGLDTDPPAAAVEVDSVVASFTGPDGQYAWLDQFWLAQPETFDLARSLPEPGPGIGHGVVRIGGRNALWQAGVVTLDNAGNPTGWDRSVLVLTWVDGQTGYRLQAKGLDLAALSRMGESLE